VVELQLPRATGPDVAKLSVVRQSQLADKAVAANCEVPHAIRHCARELPARRGGTAADDTHILLLSIHALARVDRQAVAHIHARNTVDDNLVVAGRRTHHAFGRAAPDAEWIRHRRRTLRQRAMREEAHRGKCDGIRSTAHGQHASFFITMERREWTPSLAKMFST